ncbi:MAG TPA: hypothetical protein ENK08_04150 [Chloroflexi bacterium]|nr:hypothetical protein [Chloroflexota bacterium]
MSGRWLARITSFALVLFLLAVSTSALLAAPPRQEDQIVIFFPADNAVVSGVVEIVGTVTHPNFDRYSLYYAPGPAPTAQSVWTPIVLDVRTPVVNDVLATWDTAALTEDGQRVVPDGVYTLTLVRWRQGSTSPDQVFVRNITVRNEGVETPTPTLTPLPTPVPMTPTPVPIEQPPTATPRPTPTLAPGETPPPPGEEGGDGGAVFDLGLARAAFLRGVRITLLLFALWGLYVAGKIGYRYYLRAYRSRPPDQG